MLQIFCDGPYLSARRASSDQMISLVTNQSDVGGRVVPQLAEVAAWLTSMEPSLFPTLVAMDPPILLGSDLPGMDAEFRTALVDGLLRLSRNWQFDDRGFKTRYRRLAHPGLVTQLQPSITDRDAPPTVRRVAIDIAEACETIELVEVLVNIVLDPTEEYNTRVKAALAL